MKFLIEKALVLWSGLGNIFRYGDKRDSLDEEIAFHVEERSIELVAAGHAPSVARRMAIREFGNIDRCQEECRDAWGTRFVADLLRDIRFSLRSLKRSKVYASIVMITLIFCIAGNTTAFTALHRLFLEPLPFENPQEIVEVYNSLPRFGIDKQLVSIQQFTDYREKADAFQRLALWRIWSYNVGEDVGATRGVGAQVTASYFEMLGVEPLLGSFLLKKIAQRVV